MRWMVCCLLFMVSISAYSIVEYDATLLYPPDDAVVDTVTVKFYDGTDLSSIASSYSARSQSFNLAETNEIGGYVDLLDGQDAYASMGDDYIGLPPLHPNNQTLWRRLTIVSGIISPLR